MAAARNIPTKPKPGVKLEDVAFYFDSVERDRLDTAGPSRKSGEVLALRERLLQLPDPEFDAAIKTLRTLVYDARRDDGDGKDHAGRKARGQTLYDEVRQGRNGKGGASSTGKVSPA